MFLRDKLLMLAVFIITVFLINGFVTAAPSGASVNNTNTSSGTVSSTAGNDSAQAGNVSELVLYGASVTQTWQGYYGNVTGGITLSDSASNVFYNWSLASPSGEVYASTNQSITWSNVQCFNFTANGTYEDDTGQAGNTSLYGTNLTQLESRFNIATGAADGVDETFSLNGTGSHDAFNVGSLSFTEGECKNTRIFDSSGAGVSNNFEEVLLYEPSTASVVFAAILENDVSGFNSKTSDFEMLVLEDGHNGDTSSTPYYFFVELQ
jgi:hypothetical protein